MSGIEAFIVFPVAAFHFAIVSRRIRPDQLMADAVPLQMVLKEGRLVPVGGKAVGELCAIVRLYALNGEGEGFEEMFHKEGGGIGAVFFKGLHKTPSGILVNSSILEETFANDAAVDKTGGGDKLHIDLEALTGIVHLLIRLRDILGVRGMDSHDALFFEETVEAGDGAGVAALGELYPEHDKAGIRVTPAHIEDEFGFLRGMLVRVVVGSSGAVAEGLDRAVIAAFPAVDILPVGLIFDGSFRDPKFISIVEER